MVTCSCGKTIEKVPSWLQGTKVAFVCNHCPNRQVKGITQITFEPVKEPGEDIGALEGEPELDDEEED